MNDNLKKYFQMAMVGFGLYLAIHYWPLLISGIGILLLAATPLIFGMIIAYVMNILMIFYEKKLFVGKRIISMAAAFVSVIGILIILLSIVIPELISCVKLLLEYLPGSMQTLFAWLNDLGILSSADFQKIGNIDWDQLIQAITKLLSNGAFSSTAATISSFAKRVVDVVIGLIFSFYLLVSKDHLLAVCKRVMRVYLKAEWIKKIQYVLHVLNDSFHRYIVGQCIEAVILGSLCGIGMGILGFPYASMTGAVVGFTALIPIAGAYIGGTVGFLLIMTVSFKQAFFFVLYLVILQQVEGNLIYPRVVGSSLGLPALWVLAAITIGGGVMGITGMLLGVPLVSALYRILKEDLHDREAKMLPQASKTS